MTVRVFSPHPALREYVSGLLYMHLQQEPGSAPIVSPFPPTPQQALMFYLDDPVMTRKEGEEHFIERPRGVVLGPQVTRMNVQVRLSHRVLMVGFHPGGLHRLLGTPMFQLLDDGFEARAFLGRKLDQLLERMQESASPEGVASIAQGYLLRQLDQLKDLLPLDLALRELLRHRGNLPIDQVARAACLSIRQFERKCNERIGVSPKLFARIARFSHAYRLYEQRPGLTWTSIAHESGYYDQMHFIRDFREFAGITPRLLEKELSTTPYRMQAALLFSEEA